MSYCRFRNTLEDLLDCQENMEDIDDDDEVEEIRARIRLIRVCAEIAVDYAGDILDEMMV